MFEEIRRHQELQKANILRGFGINPESEDLELEIFKAQETDIEKAKHQVGDVHPNGKWVWVQLPNGKFDWRTSGGRAHKRHDEAQKQKESEGESGEQKTIEEHAADTSTETLKKVATTSDVPKKLKDAAKKELSKRGQEESGGNENDSQTSKQPKKETTGSSEQHIDAPSSVKSRKSFESYLKKNYSVVANGDYAMHEGGGRKPDGSPNDAKNVYSYHVKDKNGNISTVAYDGEKIHIYPGQRKIKLGKYGEISTVTASSRQYSNYKKL